MPDAGVFDLARAIMRNMSDSELLGYAVAAQPGERIDVPRTMAESRRRVRELVTTDREWASVVLASRPAHR